MDHLRGMTAEQVAAATLRALEQRQERGHADAQGKLMVLVSRFFPRLADRIAAKGCASCSGTRSRPAVRRAEWTASSGRSAARNS